MSGPSSASSSPNGAIGLLPALRLLVIGFCMGLANLVPGVSGGTIAFVAGIYERLIQALKSFDREALQAVLRGDLKKLWAHIPWIFLATLGVGVVLALFSMARVLAYLIDHHQTLLWAFFTGLILSSLLIVFRQIRPWETRHTVWLIGSAVFAILLTGAFSLQMPATAPFLFLAGMIAVCALILPGLSGSHVLVVLGLYGTVLEAFNTLSLVSLALFGGGMAVGVLTFAQGIGWLLKHYHRSTLAVLAGFMAGSLPAVWPWQRTVTTRINSSGEEVPLQQAPILPGAVEPTELFAVLLCLALGYGAVFLLTLLGTGKPAPLSRPAN